MKKPSHSQLLSMIFVISGLALWVIPGLAQTMNETIVVVDSSSDEAGEYPSLAIVDGYPAISYLDIDNDQLMYVRAQDAKGMNWNAPIMVDATIDVSSLEEEQTSLVVVNGRPAIAYYDYGGEILKYIRADDATGSSWTAAPVIVDGSGSGNSSDDVGMHLSMILVNGRPAISYYDYDNETLKYIQAADVNGTNWSNPVVLDSIGDVGLYTSLAVINGNPAVSYIHYDDENLKYVRATDVNGANWGTPITVDNSGNIFWEQTLVTVNGNPAIGYNDYENARIYYIRATDANGASWGPRQIVVENDSVDNYVDMAIIGGLPTAALAASSAWPGVSTPSWVVLTISSEFFLEMEMTLSSVPI